MDQPTSVTPPRNAVVRAITNTSTRCMADVPIDPANAAPGHGDGMLPSADNLALAPVSHDGQTAGFPGPVRSSGSLEFAVVSIVVLTWWLPPATEARLAGASR